MDELDMLVRVPLHRSLNITILIIFSVSNYLRATK